MSAMYMQILGFEAEALFDELNRGFDEALSRLHEEIEWEWRLKASSILNTSRQAYLDGLSVERDGAEFTVTLKGDLAVAVETGSKPYDMKPGFLSQKNVRFGINGPYVFVKMENPLRWRTAPAIVAKWWHPGIQARAIGEQVQADMDVLIERVLHDCLSRTTI